MEGWGRCCSIIGSLVRRGDEVYSSVASSFLAVLWKIICKVFDFLSFTRSPEAVSSIQRRGRCCSRPSINLTTVSSLFFNQCISLDLDHTLTPPPHTPPGLIRFWQSSKVPARLFTNSLLDIVPAETFSPYQKKRRKRGL